MEDRQDEERAGAESLTTVSVAYMLTDAQFRERRSRVLDKAAKAVIEVQEPEGGYAYPFPPNAGTLDPLFRIIALERECNPFLLLGPSERRS